MTDAALPSGRAGLHRRTARTAQVVSALPEALGALVAGYLIVGIGLTLTAHYRPATALPGGLALGVLLAVAAIRIRVLNGVRDQPGWDLAAVLAAVGSGVFNVAEDGHNILNYRDPSTYVDAAKWLSQHGGLRIPEQLGLFSSTTPPLGTSAGFSQVGDPHNVYAQGMHGVVVLSAIGGWIGDGALFAVAPIVGALALLAFYGFARRVVPSGWALVAMVGFGLTLPALAFSRDTYSEPTGMLMLFAGLSLLWLARDLGPGAQLVAGLVLGATALSRVDGYLSLLAVVVAGALALVEAPRGALRPAVVRVVALGVGTAVPALLGYLDLVRLSPVYFQSLHHDLALIGVGLVVATVGGLVLVVLSRTGLRSVWRPFRVPTGLALAAAVPVVFVGLAYRAHTLHRASGVSQAGQQFYLAATLSRQGLPFDPHTDYLTLAGLWVGWYVGPATAVLGAVGLGVMLAQGLRRDSRTLPVVVVVVVTGLLYTVSPSITPDQVWASRRLVPVVLPGVFLGTAIVGAWLGRRRPRLLARSVALLLAAATVLVPVLIGGGLMISRERAAELPSVDAVCAALPADAAVVVAPESEAALIQPLRSFCSVPAASLPLTASALAAARASAARGGRELFVIGAPDKVAGSVVTSTTYRSWETPVDRTPDRTVQTPLTLAVARVTAAGALVPIGP